MLMDEPLSSLDSQTRELLMDDLISLWTRRPFTAVYVTHDLAEAVRPRTFDRGALATTRADSRSRAA